MNSLIIAAALLSHVANAAFSDDLSSVEDAAKKLDSSVKAWSSGGGLQGALGIQGYFPTLSGAVASLSKDAGSLSDSDVDAEKITSFVSSITSLLSSITEKAQDFQSVGAGSIVANDLKELGSPSADIVKDIIGAITSDCDKISSLTPALESIAQGFSSANSAFSNNQVEFPPKPTCAGGSGGGSSSSESSAGSSSAAETSAEKSSSPAGGSSAAATSAAGGSSSEAAPKPTKSGSSSGSAPVVANNGAKAAAGIAAAGAGVVALLI